MIKIEPVKNFTASQSGSSKTNLASSESENHDGMSNETQSSDFASVLENLSSKKDSSDQKTDLTKPKEHEKDSHSRLNEHRQTEQPSKDKPNSHENNREDAAAAAAGWFNNTDNSQLETALPIPPARAILHIIDLERIISSVRAQNFDGNSQVVITLKNSVCSGLQIKLTTDVNHRVTAELIAGNEKVKAQIDARSGELADLLRQRGLKLTSLQTSVGSGMSGESENRQQPDTLETRAIGTNSAKNHESEVEQAFEVSETASNYRV